MKRRGIVAICFTALLLFGCGKGVSSKPPAARATASAEARWIAAIDARRTEPSLMAAAVGTDAPGRAHALELLARLRDPALLPTFETSLQDPDAGVRRAAAFAVARVPQGPDREAALLGRFVVEKDPGVRAALLAGLGRVADAGAFPAWEEGLAGDGALQDGACRGLLSAALAGLHPPASTVQALLETFGDGGFRGRPLCVAALSRFPAATDKAAQTATAAGLLQALVAESDEVRRFAARGLAEYPTDAVRGALGHATGDPDWRVAVQAFRSLSKVTTPESLGPLRDAIKRRVDRALAPDVSLHGEELHVLLAAMIAGFPVARETSLVALEESTFAALGTQPTNEPLSRDRGLAHCVAAEWVDLGRGWPSRLEGCGHEQVSLAERQVLMAEVLAKVVGADGPRAAYLQRLFGEKDLRVRGAVLSALASVNDKSALSMVAAGLATKDEGLAAVACETGLGLVKAHPDWLPAVPGFADALTGAVAALRRSDSLEALQSCLPLAAQVGAAKDDVRTLSHHWNRAVATAASTAAETLGLITERRPPAPIPNPIAATDVEKTLAKQSVPVVLKTDRGAFTMTLDAAAAPSTVTRFLALVDRHFYDGLAFHRVATGFVVQGGDPRGDGYGGPGWSQRCEDNTLTYGDGTVGMALAGRDTGGSQFFITYGAEPHLDGNYTAFGKVTAGMNVVLQLQQGDVIRSVRRAP